MGAKAHWLFYVWLIKTFVVFISQAITRSLKSECLHTITPTMPCTDNEGSPNTEVRHLPCSPCHLDDRLLPDHYQCQKIHFLQHWRQSDLYIQYQWVDCRPSCCRSVGVYMLLKVMVHLWSSHWWRCCLCSALVSSLCNIDTLVYCTNWSLVDVHNRWLCCWYVCVSTVPRYGFPSHILSLIMFCLKSFGAI